MRWSKENPLIFFSRRTLWKMENFLSTAFSESSQALRLVPKLPFSFIIRSRFHVALMKIPSFMCDTRKRRCSPEEEKKIYLQHVARHPTKRDFLLSHLERSARRLFASPDASNAFSLLFTANRWSGSLHSHIAWRELSIHSPFFILKDKRQTFELWDVRTFFLIASFGDFLKVF